MDTCQPTRDTLILWLQVVGKIRIARTPQAVHDFGGGLPIGRHRRDSRPSAAPSPSSETCRRDGAEIGAPPLAASQAHLEVGVTESLVGWVRPHVGVEAQTTTHVHARIVSAWGRARTRHVCRFRHVLAAPIE